jgi:membrane metallo-endopeptidase-like protein 1
MLYSKLNFAKATFVIQFISSLNFSCFSYLILIFTSKPCSDEALFSNCNFNKISLPNEKRRNASELHNPMSVTELSRTYASIPWLEYLNEILAPLVHLETTEIINVKEPRFINELETLLRKTSKRTLANYAIWRIIRDSVEYLNEEIRKRQLIYWTEVTGETEREAR